jgi:hypothetical protein
MKRAAILSRWGHVIAVMLEEDLRQAVQDAAQAVHEQGRPEQFRVELVGPVKAMTKPSGWERAFPRERKRPVSALAGIELVQRGRRSR